MSVTRLVNCFAIAAVAIAASFAANASAAIVAIDDFNVDEGHFALAPTFSGQTANLASTSTADRITTGNFEGAGNQALVLNFTTEGATSRSRHLSGSGTPANNTTFATSAGVDGWIGFAAKTTDPGWNVQLWIEPSNVAPAATGSNGGIPKNLIADGQWHIYEWNLDDNSGGADGWGTIAGIATGVATVGDGNHTIDSIVFRNAAPVGATNSIFIDFVARNTDGRLPEPASLGLAGLAALALAAARRRTA
jgi:hypothetical protein